MAETEFPVLLATNVLRLLPAPALTRATALLMRRLGRTHPRLFRALAAHEPCGIGIEPTDLRHRFVLRFGGRPVSLVPTSTLEHPLNACVRGRLATLVGLLEGRLDSDALFFSREIVITGDMEAIVAQRARSRNRQYIQSSNHTVRTGRASRPAGGTHAGAAARCGASAPGHGARGAACGKTRRTSRHRVLRTGGGRVGGIENAHGQN